MKEKIVDINPDCMSEEDLTESADALMLLINYLDRKAIAVKARLNGNIDLAIQREKDCDEIYKKLPEIVKSW